MEKAKAAYHSRLGVVPNPKLPSRVKAELAAHLERVKLLHQSDLAAGAGEVYLPYALARKYPHAAQEWGWQ